jgi:hypothetical protein
MDLYDGDNQDLLAVTDNNGWKLLKITGSGQTLELSNWDFMQNKIAYKLKINFPYLYVGSNESIDVFDISNPYNPDHIQSFPLSYFRDFQIVGSYIIAITANNLLFYNITEVGSLDLEVSYNLSLPPTSFAVNGSELLIGYENKKLAYYNINDLNAIVFVSNLQFNDFIYDIKCANNYFYLACGTDGIVSLELIESKKGTKLLASSNE